jgi:hypothetical protein
VTSARTPDDFTLLMPPGWVRLPLDGREHERVVTLVNAKVQDLPPDLREGLRRTLTKEMLDALAGARQAGGVDVFLSIAAVGEVPIAASCLVTFLDARGSVPLEGLVTEFVAAAQQVAVISIAGAPAVRRQSVQDQESGDTVLRTTMVDFFVPVPESTGLLVLSFATALEPLAEALVQLFDAMAESLRWVQT